MNTEPASAGDLPAIRHLLASNNLPDDDLTADMLGRFVVLRRDGQLSGVVGIESHRDVALLRSLAVSEELRGKGYGGVLVEAAESLSQASGATAIYLLTTTAESFFAARGYRRIDRDLAPAAIRGTTQFSALCPSTAIVMVKP